MSVAKRNLMGLQDVSCVGGKAPITGTGLLLGVWILPGEDGICRFENGTVICVDNEMGFLREGEKCEV